MTNKSIAKSLVMFSVFVFISAFDTSINSISAQSCPDTAETDAAIVKSVYDSIRNHRNKKLKDQLTHINIVSKNRAVKIQGWATNKKNHKIFIGLLSKPSCVRLVNEALFAIGKAAYDKTLSDKKNSDPFTAQSMMSCKICGEICIDDDEPCNSGESEN